MSDERQGSVRIKRETIVRWDEESRQSWKSGAQRNRLPARAKASIHADGGRSGPCRVQAAQGRADTPRPKKELTEAQRKARKHAAAKMRAAWLTGQDRRCD
jgi:hypothetical protein